MAELVPAERHLMALHRLFFRFLVVGILLHSVVLPESTTTSAYPNPEDICFDVSTGSKTKSFCDSWDLGIYGILTRRTPAADQHTLEDILDTITDPCRDVQAPRERDNLSLSYLVPIDVGDSTYTRIRIDYQEAYSPVRLDRYHFDANSTLLSTMLTDLTLVYVILEQWQSLVTDKRGKVVYFFTDIPCNDPEYTFMSKLLEVFATDGPIRTLLSDGIPFRLFWLKQNTFDTCLPYLQNLTLPPGFEDFIKFVPYNADMASYAENYGLCEEAKDASKKDIFPWWMIAVVVVVFMTASIVIGICMRKFCPRMCCCINTHLEELDKLEAAAPNYYSSSPSAKNLEPINPPPDHWEIGPYSLEISADRLGSGAYAVVYRGILRGIPPILKVAPSIQLSISLNANENVVAVKMAHAHASNTDLAEFQQEIAFMKSLGYHPHLASLLGCQTDPLQPCIVTEICERGDLLGLLRSEVKEETNFLTIDDFLNISWQISDALVYLAAKNIIHRDVAARNVLVTENKVVKLSDFGLCRFNDTFLYTTRGGRLPIKWMASESLEFAQFSTKTDVWSYGVLLYELYSWGMSPYFAQEPEEMLNFLKQGGRLVVPECPVIIKSLMKRCWSFGADDRPDFEEIRSTIYAILRAVNGGDGYLDVALDYCQV